LTFGFVSGNNFLNHFAFFMHLGSVSILYRIDINGGNEARDL